jgi:hypothetical protein
VKHHALEAVKSAMMALFNVEYAQVATTRLYSIKVSETMRVFSHNLVGGKYNDKTYYIVTTGPFQRQCGNLKKEPPYNQMHTSSSTSWIIQKLYVHQRCFCVKKTSPKFLHPDLPCSKYTSDGFPLSKTIALALYKNIVDCAEVQDYIEYDRDIGKMYENTLQGMSSRMRVHFDDKLPSDVQKSGPEGLLYGVPKKETVGKPYHAGLEKIKMYMTTAAVEYEKARSIMNQSPSLAAGRKRKRNSFA